MSFFAPSTPLRAALIVSAVLSTFAPLQGCSKESNLSAEEHIELAKDMEANGNLKGMVIQLKNAIQKSPDNPQARLMLGEAYLEFKQADSAIKELTQARKLGVGEARITPLIGEALLQNREYQRVLDEIQTSDSSSPRDRARVMQLRADALLGLRKFPEGCALFEASSQVDPQWHKALIGIAGCEYAQGHVDAARSALIKATQIAPQSSESWVSLAKLERSENRPNEARKALDSALKANNADLDALVERASLLVDLKDYKAATRDAERIRSLYPKHFLGEYALALIAFNEKKVDIARDHVALALQLAPGHLPSLLLSGAIEYALGNMQTAETQLNRVVQSWPRHPYANRLLAAAQLGQGRVDEAAKTIKKADPDQSEDVAIRLLAGEIALARKQFAEANRHFEKAAALQPENAGIRTQLAKARLGQGDPRALDDLRAASAMDATWQGADSALILDQIRNRQFDAALQSIATLEKKAPDSPQPWNFRGLVYLSQQDFPKARENFEKALKLDPAYLPATANLAELDLHDNKPEAAKARFESVLKADKSNLDAMLGLAGLANRAGNRAEQLAWLERAHKSAPQAPQPLVLLSNFYLNQGDYAKALVYAREANDAHPNDTAALGVLGDIQLASGEVDSALSTFRKLAELAPRSAAVRLRLARAQVANKQSGAAHTTLLKASELDPTSVAVQDAQLQLEMAEHKFEAALQIARKLQANQPNSPLGYEREGDIRVAQGQADQAVAPYEQALKRGQSAAATIKLLRALHFSGNTRRADEQIAAWLTQHPQDKLMRAYAAEYYLVTGRNRNAIAQYEYLLRLEPKRADYLNNLANLYLRERDKRAQATAERALALAPDSPGIQDTLGWILVEKGELAAGLGWLKKAVSAAPKAASIRYHYAAALARSGDTPRAKKELQALLAAQPQFPEAEAARKLLATL
jgi:putative PEP-CTERM system TPR-repeat lipoprotein